MGHGRAGRCRGASHETKVLEVWLGVSEEILIVPGVERKEVRRWVWMKPLGGGYSRLVVGGSGNHNVLVCITCLVFWRGAMNTRTRLSLFWTSHFGSGFFVGCNDDDGTRYGVLYWYRLRETHFSSGKFRRAATPTFPVSISFSCRPQSFKFL